ncbi:MAG: hypothetical protein MUF72_11430 [Elainella sp. Prado103]|nr:hypothetical protein [Elainella sp. Prado103]
MKYVFAIGSLVGTLSLSAVWLTASQAQGNCHPAYPTVCIAPPPPDLDCADVPHRNFAVQSPDPHRFDGDRDGIGCESW